MSNSKEFNLRKRLAAASAIVLGGISLAGCDVGKTGYTAEQKATLETLIKPEAVKIAEAVISNPKNIVTLSNDKKTYLISQDQSTANKSNVFVEITNTGQPVNANNVSSISFNHYVTDPADSTKLTIDSSVRIDGGGDHINDDTYWFVDSYSVLSDTNGDKKLDSNDFTININDMPQTDWDSHKMDMEHITDTTKTILEDLQQRYEPDVFGHTL